MQDANNSYTFEINIPEKISTNKIYSGVHWATRARHKDLFVWNFLSVASEIPVIESCDLEFHFEFKQRPLDCDNCSYMTKLLIDCLRHYGKLKDDTPNIVRSVKITSKKGNEDKVKILIDF